MDDDDDDVAEECEYLSNAQAIIERLRCKRKKNIAIHERNSQDGIGNELYFERGNVQLQSLHCYTQ